jgi:hypothetical protein
MCKAPQKLLLVFESGEVLLWFYANLLEIINILFAPIMTDFCMAAECTILTI